MYYYSNDWGSEWKKISVNVISYSFGNLPKSDINFDNLYYDYLYFVKGDSFSYEKNIRNMHETNFDVIYVLRKVSNNKRGGYLHNELRVYYNQTNSELIKNHVTAFYVTKKFLYISIPNKESTDQDNNRSNQTQKVN